MSCTNHTDTAGRNTCLLCLHRYCDACVEETLDRKGRTSVVLCAACKGSIQDRARRRIRIGEGLVMILTLLSMFGILGEAGFWVVARSTGPSVVFAFLANVGAILLLTMLLAYLWGALYWGLPFGWRISSKLGMGILTLPIFLVFGYAVGVLYGTLGGSIYQQFRHDRVARGDLGPLVPQIRRAVDARERHVMTQEQVEEFFRRYGQLRATQALAEAGILPGSFNPFR